MGPKRRCDMSLSQWEIKDIFTQTKTIITGDHFVYAKKETGWFHGSDYINKDAIYPYTQYVSNLCKEIARHFSEVSPLGSYRYAVVGPTVGAVNLTQWTAHWFSNFSPRIVFFAICADEEDVLLQRQVNLSCKGEFQANGKVKIEDIYRLGSSVTKVEVTYFEKIGTKRVIKRGYNKHVEGVKCLIVEDVINSGATVAKTRDAILEAGGEIVGVGALCNRSGGKVTAETLGVPELFSLLDVDMKMFPEDECPICKERGPASVRTDLGKGSEFLVRKGL